MFDRFKQILLAVICMMGSCTREYPIPNLARSDIEYINLGDCASRRFPIGDEEIIDRFWQAVSSAKEVELEDLKLNTGFARIWIQTRSAEEAISFEVVASTIHGPVIVFGRKRLICKKCDGFFTELKKTYPEFNWCEAPRIQ